MALISTCVSHLDISTGFLANGSDNARASPRGANLYTAKNDGIESFLTLKDVIFRHFRASVRKMKYAMSIKNGPAVSVPS